MSDYNTCTSDNYDTDDYDYDSDTDDISIIKKILNNPISKLNNCCDIYKLSSKDIVQINRRWSFNRQVNVKHYSNISNDLEQMKNKHLMGTIKLVIDNNYNIKIIDGQHRIKAIEEDLLNNPNSNFDHLCEVYKVTDVNYDREILDLFKNANKNLNVKNSDIPCKILIDTIDKLKKDYPKCIKGDNDISSSNTTKVNRPNVTTKELYTIIQSSNIISEYNLDENKLYNKIKKYNLSIGSSWTIKELCGNDNQTSQNVYKKAKQYQFYLGLKRIKGDLANDWIYNIKNEISNI